MQNKTITVALTGASGLPYAFRLIESLLHANCQVWVVSTQAAHIVAAQEMNITLPTRPAAMKAFFLERFNLPESTLLSVFHKDDWFAPIASGSGAADAMVVVPCTMGTLAAISMGTSESLMDRAADVMIKEQRKLILVPREAPYSAIHLEHMLKLARLGVVILPPNPGFYTHPKTIEDMIDFVVARILDQLNIQHSLMQAWGHERS